MSESPAEVRAISAITLTTGNMARALRFYQDLGFRLHHGGPDSNFSSLTGGSSFVNLIPQGPDRGHGWWGRVIFHVSDVDAFYRRALERGYRPEDEPRDAEWGERYFHITDPDGNELSFAKPLNAEW
jgi:catechol 2,3-dioxygenase-like lactoylglutathione lyase family enzyme